MDTLNPESDTWQWRVVHSRSITYAYPTEERICEDEGEARSLARYVQLRGALHVEVSRRAIHYGGWEAV